MLSFSSWIWQKAFDRLEWDFIAIALQRQGIMVISSTSSEPVYPLPHSRSLSTEATPTFRAQRGIRQGCPLSPFCYCN